MIAWKDGLDSLFKEVRVFKEVDENGPFSSGMASQMLRSGLEQGLDPLTILVQYSFWQCCSHSLKFVVCTAGRPVLKKNFGQALETCENGNEKDDDHDQDPSQKPCYTYGL